MSNAGIDYGMGRSNVDVATGIRFGVISQNTIGQALADSDLEYDYGEPTCPRCGGIVVEYHTVDDSMLAGGARPHDEWTRYKEHGCDDFACEQCEEIFDNSDCYGDEAIGWHYDADGYQLASCLDNDAMVLASPFYTFAQYCSPCVPGAGNLDNPIEDGAKTYCLGHDWFEDGKAPYPVFSVETGAEVHPA